VEIGRCRENVIFEIGPYFFGGKGFFFWVFLVTIFQGLGESSKMTQKNPPLKREKQQKQIGEKSIEGVGESPFFEVWGGITILGGNHHFWRSGGGGGITISESQYKALVTELLTRANSFYYCFHNCGHHTETPLLSFDFLGFWQSATL